MVAISDATALICLAKTSNLTLLKSLGESIIVAQTVLDEIEQKNDGIAEMIVSCKSFHIQSAQNKKLFKELESVGFRTTIELEEWLMSMLNR